MIELFVEVQVSVMGTVGHADTIGGVNVVVPAANSTNVYNMANIYHTMSCKYSSFHSTATNTLWCYKGDHCTCTEYRTSTAGPKWFSV